MEYRNKIIKYKLKKIKIENKINELVTKKKNSYLKFIDKITATNISIFSEIINKLKNNENNEKIYVVVTGIYGVGKSTIIKLLEKIFEQNNTYFNFNENNIEKLTDEFVINNNNSYNKLIFIEININLLNQLLKKIENTNFFVINIVPNDNQSYKNKLINKIFIDIKSNENNFILNTQKNYDNHQFLYDNINKIKNFEKSILTDNDFNFIDEIAIKLINYGKLYKIENSIYKIFDIEF